jgi:8-amino-7-oxononanoate synthase
MSNAAADKVSSYVTALNVLKDDDRLRSLKPRTGIDFLSNDYLALASAPRMRKAVSAAVEAGTPIGAGGSRLLRGNCEEHESLEAAAASFFGAEAAIFFGSGYVANFAVLTTLPQRGDLLVLDQLVHASIHEGARAGRADFRESRHNDPQSVETTIRDWRAEGGAGRVWIVVERLYSMDGDFAPLEGLIEPRRSRSCDGMPIHLAGVSGCSIAHFADCFTRRPDHGYVVAHAGSTIAHYCCAAHH